MLEEDLKLVGYSAIVICVVPSDSRIKMPLCSWND